MVTILLGKYKLITQIVNSYPIKQHMLTTK